ncbi:NAD(P)/FAD-dependent oxidoreductase [Jatrophihabitans telluris]|uniref:NAD(P)/FAD-dependent oxidoreductase n=1 Tax=Jatrophihabitans telluris TaxID=2038343 RepID=A0ABY4QYB5_9ACTN|nr:NAD(P)/FAD-dependent oxidoreductase [Jatrophihabitans telluris]UQX88510.1 NAD(P)/FAD-dependent oxidoreductase [Jatrophihabitans telluris]
MSSELSGSVEVGTDVDAQTALDSGTGALPAHVGVLVVGAGFGGLAAAIKLDEVGEHDYLVIDRGDEVGGTWRDNTYPGAACDVPSQLYSFSFALNPDWSRSFSPQREVQDYLRRVANSAGVLDRFRFRTSLLDAAWDAEAALWRVNTDAGGLTATVLVAATGALSDAKVPDIDGIAEFRGELFHSSHWNHDYDLTGKRVAVIGTGASSIQIVPEIAGHAARVDVYQRTAPWVMPRHDRAISDVERVVFRRVPTLQRLARAGVYWAREATVPMFTLKPGLGRLAQGQARKNIARAIADPALREAVTPSFALGCKRVLISSDWYPALARDNVDLITSGITAITGNGVVTADGVTREADAIVVATGFMPTETPVAKHIIGKDGRTLSEHWSDHGVQAYKGASVSGFPNLFFIVGPNTGLGHSSMVFMIESQVGYLIDAVRTMRRHGLASVEVDREAEAAYNIALQRRMKRTVWNTGGCSSWYLDDHGRNVTLWPRSTVAFRRMTARFDLAAYHAIARDDVPSHQKAWA